MSPISNLFTGLGLGRELWHVNYGEGYSVVPRPLYVHWLLFVSSSFDAAEFYAIKPEGAKGDASGSHIAWKTRKGAPHSASMVVLDNELYFVSDGGIATCVDARSGDMHWTQRLGGGFSASPIAAEGRIYFQNEAGVGFVIKASKTYELLSKNDLGEPTLAFYAAADNALYICGKRIFSRSPSESDVAALAPFTEAIAGRPRDR